MNLDWKYQLWAASKGLLEADAAEAAPGWPSVKSQSRGGNVGLISS